MVIKRKQLLLAFRRLHVMSLHVISKIAYHILTHSCNYNSMMNESPPLCFGSLISIARSCGLLMDAFLYGEAPGEKLEFKWNEDISKVKTNLNGSTGWAYIHRRSGGKKDAPPHLCRVHICRNTPC